LFNTLIVITLLIDNRTEKSSLFPGRVPHCRARVSKLSRD